MQVTVFWFSLSDGLLPRLHGGKTRREGTLVTTGAAQRHLFTGQRNHKVHRSR
jgi:hypothetical protein